MSIRRVVGISGAFMAWVMGSGFATGQEIFQFFTSYGYYSYILILINLAGFLLVGTGICAEGQMHPEEGFDHFRYFCGNRIGMLYNIWQPIIMVAGMVILISGSGAVFQEFYGLNHYLGALLMAALSFTAYVMGFQRFMKTVSLIGPVIIVFTLVVGLITVCRDFSGLEQVPLYRAELSAKESCPFWWLSGVLYLSYNLCGGSKYYTALGQSGFSLKEVKTGVILGGVLLMLGIFLMNTAMLTDAGHTAVLDIPTLFLAKKISFVLSAVFSVILILGIFSSCSIMMWTACEHFTEQGTRKSYVLAGAIALGTFLLGLLSFSSLISMVYPLAGYLGIPFLGFVIYKRIFKTAD